MDAAAFRRHGHELVEWIADYFEHPERYPVLSRVAPGAIRDAIPAAAPEDAESFAAIMADFERVLVPGLTHWNHPGFFGYFAISGSPPGVLAEFLAAALNQQAMLWRTSPAATELEEVSLAWLRRLIGLPDAFEGVIYDTASISTMHALAAAREAAVPNVRTAGLARPGTPPLRIYASEEAHSSVDKAAIAIGLGTTAVRRIAVDEEFRMRPDALSDAIAADRADGCLPVAIVATVGTTSTTSIDPVAAIAAISEREQVWLHVDAAYGGIAAMLPSHAAVLEGADRADSLVVNPHKWLFTPVDLSAFYCRRMDVVRAAFTLTPEYLRTAESGAVHNLMDTGVPLGRRFRSLKLWMILRAYGAREIRAHISRHISLARQFAEWVDAHPEFERLAPVPLSVVCFRWRPPNLGGAGEPGQSAGESALAEANERLLNRVNATGEVFLSHTRIRGVLALRLAVGHLRTEEAHVRRAWEILQAQAALPTSAATT